MTDFSFHFQIIRNEKSPRTQSDILLDTLNYRICRQQKKKEKSINGLGNEQ